MIISVLVAFSDAGIKGVVLGASLG